MIIICKCSKILCRPYKLFNAVTVHVPHSTFSFRTRFTSDRRRNTMCTVGEFTIVPVYMFSRRLLLTTIPCISIIHIPVGIWRVFKPLLNHSLQSPIISISTDQLTLHSISRYYEIQDEYLTDRSHFSLDNRIRMKRNI